MKHELLEANADLASRVARLEIVAKIFKDRYMENYWIENDEDGFTGWRWEKYSIELTIVCAANRWKDIVIPGPRHFSPVMNIGIDLIGQDALDAYAGGDQDQGFIDQYGTYHTRRAAMEMCLKSGRELNYERGGSKTQLFSEHIC